MVEHGVMSRKKKTLLELKQRLLNDIKRCEMRIEEQRSRLNPPTLNDDNDSSDSDAGFPTLNSLPSSTTLSTRQQQLEVLLQATKELTNLQIMESEVSVLVETPQIENGAMPTEDGLWREVAVECRVDLIPVTITFLIHQPHRKFAAPSYYKLRVSGVKRAHDRELSRSVLNTCKLPGDAIEIVRSYAAAHRSRRGSLSALADKYAEHLFMEPLPEGGYLLKCGEMMTVAWSLQNKWSSIAPFHHRMKFEIGYMDENNLRQIRQAHQQLIDPTIDTEERTHFLSKIIDTCLALGVASGCEESDADTDKINQTRTTLEEIEPENPPEGRNEKDNRNEKVKGAMPPPRRKKIVKTKRN